MKSNLTRTLCFHLGLNDKIDTVTSLDERRIVEQIWQEIRPLYRLVHAYVRQQMTKIYPKLVSPDQPIPIHLTSKIKTIEMKNKTKRFVDLQKIFLVRC